jgi:hypothetical protein
MEIAYRDKLLARINRKDWWHVPPADPMAYRKRGKFLASTFREAEFWGRPLDTPIRIHVHNPIIGDEPSVEAELLGAHSQPPEEDSKKTLDWRWKLDAKLKKAASAKGYDSVVLMSRCAYAKFLLEGRLPLSLELNLLCDGMELNATETR